MWTATYDRHLLEVLYKTSKVDSKYYMIAWIVYQWWTFFYLMSPFPVKQVSLFRHENGVTFLRGKESKTQNGDTLWELKMEKSKQFHWL